jgi:hypothetical protein
LSQKPFIHFDFVFLSPLPNLTLYKSLQTIKPHRALLLVAGEDNYGAAGCFPLLTKPKYWEDPTVGAEFSGEPWVTRQFRSTGGQDRSFSTQQMKNLVLVHFRIF